MIQPVDVAHRVPSRLGSWSETNGRVSITKRKFGPIGTRIARLLRLSPDIRITLDAVGSAAWNRMDGRNVSDILLALESLFPDEGRLDERLGAYLGHLARHGLVEFEKEEKSASKTK